MPKKLKYFMIIFMAANLMCTAFLSAVSPDQLVKDGIALRDAGKITEALTKFNEVIKTKPKHAAANFELGQTYLKIGDDDNAIKYLNQALTYGYNEIKVRALLVNAYLSSGRTSEASMDLQILLDKDPKNLSLLTLQGDLYLQKTGTLYLAEESYRHVLEIDPNYVSAIVGLGNYYKAKRQVDSAFIMYEKAISINPAYASAHYNYALLLLEKKQYDKSVAELNKFIALEPRNSRGYVKLADVYSKMADANPQQKLTYYETAVTNVNQALTLGDTTVGTLKFLSFLYRKAGKPSENKDVLKKILAKSPQEVPIWIELGQTYAKLDSYNLAIPCYFRAISIDTNQWNTLSFTLGFAYYQTNKFDSSVTMFSEKIRRDTLAAGAYMNRALAYLQLKKNELAIKDFEKGLKIQPNYAQGWLWLGQTSHYLGNKPKADAAYKQVIKLEPAGSNLRKEAEKLLKMLYQVAEPVQKVDYVDDDYDPGDTLY